ncbi:MAG TPA: serine/threonine-protein kinase, partial [Polyangiaceae bacterium]|nr:serine/threonine-protein kinase [Polyangiaceae bacterium]
MGLASGTQIGPYEIGALLGAGGMGEVYRAVDTRLGRQVAIKVLIASGHDSDRLRRFEVETQTVSSLQHANILALFDVGNYQERPFLVSELLHGETLKDLLQRSPLEPAKAADLAVQLCHGLAAAHDKGIVHRDIKPENLFITREGVLKILDFGIAKRTANETSRALEKPPVTVTENTETGTVLGTAGYMSPEQVRGQAADRRSDLFSAGAVLYEMLTGQRAFQRASTLETAYAIVKDEPEELPPSVPTALAHIVRRCLEKQPDDRFQSSRELAAALEASRLAPQGVGFAATEASASAPLEKLLPNAGRKAESGTAAGQVLSPVPPARAEISRATRVPRVVRVVMMVVVAAVMSTGSWFGWRHFKAASAAPRIMMAVLPFEDFTGDSQKEYFADGLTEGMISQLGRLQPERLAVIARTSVNQYRHTKKSIKEIGSELGVQYVLECSVQRVDDRMRVDAQLIHTSDQTQLWSDSYEREIKDVLVLQSEVARAIAAQVRVKLSSEQTAGLSRTRSLNPAAYDAYLRGDYFRAKASEDGIRQAMTYFEQATKLDPGYAVAYAGLAGVTAAQPVYD